MKPTNEESESGLCVWDAMASVVIAERHYLVAAQHIESYQGSVKLNNEASFGTYNAT